MFGKRHDNVLRNIDNLICKLDNINLFGVTQSNFKLSSYVDGHNRTNRKYDMTIEGYALLVLGYTGLKAMNTKTNGNPEQSNKDDQN